MEHLNPIGNKVFIVRSTTARAKTGKRTFDKAFGPSIGLEVPDALGFDNMLSLSRSLMSLLLQIPLKLVSRKKFRSLNLTYNPYWCRKRPWISTESTTPA
jgi:hypothetical protein